MPVMTRNPYEPGAGNYENPSPGPFQFYEQRYTFAGPQEWIFSPDGARMAITVFFPLGGGSCFIEGSDESPFDINKTLPSRIIPGDKGNIHIYPITDTIQDTTRVVVEACTAVRVNVLGGTVDVTVHC
jgi:hypothetical protein